jgi:hypothetical protein
MKIALRIQVDNENSYPSEELEITPTSTMVYVKLGDRVVSVDKKEFLAIMHMIDEMTPKVVL